MIEPGSRLLVVGGEGFIGGEVARQARDAGVETTVLSLRPRADGDRHRLYADITDAGDLARALDGREFDYVVNAGGYIDHAAMHAGGLVPLAAHFGGVVNLVGAVRGPALKGFVQLGSSDEYGDAPAPQHESMREQPISCYAAAKVATTQLLQMLHRTEGFPATVLRLFLVYGPGQGTARFLPQVIRGCLSGDSFPVSAGEQLRDFAYVGDVAKAIFQALAGDRARGRVVNVGSGEPVAIRAMVERVVTLVGAGRPRFGEIPYRAGENMALYPCTRLAREVLHWQASTCLDDGLARTIGALRQAGHG